MDMIELRQVNSVKIYLENYFKNKNEINGDQKGFQTHLINMMRESI